ncbi:MAG: hypothetical protein RIM84_20995 [Alphaproteobacteria bacterium]
MTTYTLDDVGPRPTGKPYSARDKQNIIDGWNRWEATGRARFVWERQMARARAEIPDALEAVYDVLTDEQKAALAPDVVDKIEAKKALRAQRPQGE